jgi:hypothetical protein
MEKTFKISIFLQIGFKILIKSVIFKLIFFRLATTLKTNSHMWLVAVLDTATAGLYYIKLD